jgi:small-conductance mechanosensitive channel
MTDVALLGSSFSRAAVDFDTLAHALQSPQALMECAVLALCVALAYVVAAQFKPRGHKGSDPGDHGDHGIWLAARPVQGALFPVLALGLVLAARWALKAPWGGGWGALVIFRLAVPVLVSFVIVRIGARVLQAALPHSAVARALERTLSWVVVLGFALWITGLWQELMEDLEHISWHFGGADVTLRAMLNGAVSAVMVMMAVLWLSSALEARLLSAAGDAKGDTLSVRKMAANGLRALLLFVGVLLALSAAGIPLGALGVMGGAVGVGIGLGLQRLAANYVSGFVILAERSLRIGDIVKVDNFEGRVTDIQTRYTVIRAYNGREAIVPNETLLTTRIENASLADPTLALTSTFQVAYGTDVKALMPALVRAVEQVPRVLKQPGPAVQLSNFTTDGLELTVVFWIDDPQRGQGNVRSDVNLKVLQALMDAGAKIPSPATKPVGPTAP